jgi:DNA-binding transcriptional MerR regulator
MSSVTTQDGTPETHARMRDSELPSKLFFRIGEVAGLVGVEPHVLRYWEREFRSIRPTKSAKGQRVYSRKDVENLLRVRDLLYRDGFTIAGAKKRLQRPTAAASPTVEASLSDPVAQIAAADLEAEAAPDAETHPKLDAQRDERDARDEREDEELTAADPESGPRQSGVDPMREKLTALRTEIEGFLDELESDRSERA